MKVTEFPQDPVEAYDQAELAALQHLGNRAIEASSTPVFDRIGYPTRVRSTKELWRYADVMHDGRAEKAYERLGGFTKKEFNLLHYAICTGANTSSLLGRRVVPVDASVMAVIPYRLITMCIQVGAVFELGPGSGYLGTMLKADGFDYRSTDACQAFFLWQKQLGFDLQVPWWEWYDHSRAFGLKFDVVVANHVLNELHETALRYFVVRAERMLTDKGFLVVEDWGDQRIRDTNASKHVFFHRGWTEAAGGYLLIPPGGSFDVASINESSQIPLGLPYHWDDVVKIWADLGARPNPDAEFARFCDNKPLTGRQ